jgi:molecular chaperone DnaK (HSP70)
MKVVNEPPEYGSDIPPTFEVPPLPTGVTLKRVYQDFLRYLWDHAQDFFKNNTVDGERIWNKLGSKAFIVLATPNGWDTTQQGFLRQAMIDAGIIAKGADEDRLFFVTEGEASVHYALHYSQSRSWMKENGMFAVTDAGGSTVDSTLYRCKALLPKLVLEEVTASECGMYFFHLHLH